MLIPLVIISGLAWRAARRAARRTWAPLLLLAGSYAGGEVFFQLLKIMVGRPRPPAALAIGHFTGLAFPSGHATLSAAVYGMGAALIARATNRSAVEVAAWVGAGLVALLVGLTRLYLGAHWLSDVLAGWALGAAWTATVLLLSRRRTASRSGSSSPSAGRGPGWGSGAASAP